MSDGPRVAAPGERLVRANEIDIQLDSSGQAHLRCGGRRLSVGSHGLAILTAFGTPRTIPEALDRLAVGGARDFVDLTATIATLREAGVLVGEADATFASEARGWDSPSIHVQMLRDVARTRAFIRALEATVGPDDVVLDVGTGTGILAMAAARAGARKVYAVEASKIADLARRSCEDNGLSDRIEVVRGWSTQVALPERATVLVTETIGAEPLSERIVDIVHDAWARHLAPGARVIPAAVRVMATLAALPADLADRHLFTAENARTFRQLYGFDFETFRQAQEASVVRVMLNQAEFRSLKRLSDAVVLATIDLSARPDLVFRREVSVRATHTGTVDAVVIHFELDLAPSLTFDGHPERVAATHSWDFVAWLSGKRRSVSAGAEVEVVYDYAAGDARVSLP